MARQPVFPQPLLVLGACGLLAAALVAQQPAAAPADAPFRNAALPIEQRVEAILAAMTLDEKLACLQTSTAVPRLGIPDMGGAEGLHQLVRKGGFGPEKPIPTTSFALTLGLGATWDPALLRRAGEAQGVEARYITQQPEVPPGGPGQLAERRPRARPALGPLRGELQRGSVPDRHARAAPTSAASRATIRRTGAPRRCSSTTSPTATRRRARDPRPTSTRSCSASTTRCRSAWPSGTAGRARSWRPTTSGTACRCCCTRRRRRCSPASGVSTASSRPISARSAIS